MDLDRELLRELRDVVLAPDALAHELERDVPASLGVNADGFRVQYAVLLHVLADDLDDVRELVRDVLQASREQRDLLAASMNLEPEPIVFEFERGRLPDPRESVREVGRPLRKHDLGRHPDRELYLRESPEAVLASGHRRLRCVVGAVERLLDRGRPLPDALRAAVPLSCLGIVADLLVARERVPHYRVPDRPVRDPDAQVLKDDADQEARLGRGSVPKELRHGLELGVDRPRPFDGRELAHVTDHVRDHQVLARQRGLGFPADKAGRDNPEIAFLLEALDDLGLWRARRERDRLGCELLAHPDLRLVPLRVDAAPEQEHDPIEVAVRGLVQEVREDPCLLEALARAADAQPGLAER